MPAGTNLQELSVSIKANTKGFTEPIEAMRTSLRRTINTVTAPIDDLNRKMGDLQVRMGMRTESTAYKKNAQDIERMTAALQEYSDFLQTIPQNLPSNEYKELSTSLEEAIKNLEQAKAAQDALVQSGGATRLSEEYAAMDQELVETMAHIVTLQKQIETYKGTLAREAPFTKSYMLAESAIQKCQVALDAANIKARELASNLADMEQAGTQYVPTEQMMELSRTTEAAGQKVDSLREKMAALSGAGLDVIPNEQYAEGVRTIEMGTQALDAMNQKQAEMVRNGERFESVTRSGSKAMSALSKVMSGTVGAGRKLLSAIRSCSGAFASLVRRMASGIPTIRLFNKHTQNTGDTVRNVVRGFLRYGLGIRSMMVLMNKVRSAVMEGINNLVQYDPTGPLNQSLSQLKSSLTQLKNALGAAFAPIITAVTPLLLRLISMLTRAAEAVGMFVSALTGVPYIKAKAVQQNYADSLDTTAKKATKAKEATEKLKRELLGFDQITKLSDQSDSNTNSDTDNDVSNAISPSDMFENGIVTTKWAEFAEKLKEIFKGIFDVFKQAWETTGERVIDSMKKAFQAVKDLIADIGSTFYRVFTEGYGYEWLVSLFNLIADVFDIITAIATKFKEAWDDDNRGYNYVKSIFEMFTSINMTLSDIAQSFVNAWNNETGYKIISGILELLTRVHEVIKNASDSFREAWNDNGNGERVLWTLLNLIGDIIWALEGVAAAFANAFASPIGTQMWSSLLQMIGVALTILDDITVAFTNAWNDGGRGVTYIQSIFGILRSVFDLLGSIGTAFHNVWSNGIGERICRNILDILIAVNGAVSALVDRFREAWEAGGNGERIIGAVLKIINNVLEAVKKIAEATKKWAEGLNLEPIVSAFGTLLEAIEPLVGLISDGLAWAYENVLLPFASWTIEEALPVVIDALAAAFNVLHAALEAISPGLQSMWNNIVKPLAETVGAILVSVLKAITEKLNAFADWINNNQEQFASIVDTCLLFIAAWMGAKGIITIISGVTSAASLLSGGLATLVSTGFNPVLIAIAAVIAGCVLLITHWEEVVGVLTAPVPVDTFDEVTLALTDLDNIIFELSYSSDVTSEQLDMLRKAVADAKLEGKDTTETLKAFKTACEEAGIGTEPLSDACEEAGVTLDMLKEALDGTKTGAEEMADVVEETASTTQTAMSNIGTAGQEHLGSVTEAAENAGVALDNLGTGGNDLESELQGALSQIYSDADKYIGGVVGSVSEAKQSFENLSQSGKDTSSSVVGSFGNLQSGVTREITTAAENATSKSNEMKSEVTSDNRELDQDTAEKFAAIRETIRSEMNRAADIAGMKSKTIKREALSAFKDLASDSVPYFESLRGTVDEQLGEVVKIVENSARAIKEAFDGIGEEIARNFSGTETAVRREMGDFQAIGSDKARDVANAFQNISYTIAGHFADVTSRVANTLTGMYDVGRNAAQAFANGLRSVHIDTPHLVTTSYSEYVIGDSRITVPNLSVQWYARGGFPPNGQLFMAGENGPEMVGQMGSRNAVVNNEQIVDGIRDGVYDGIMSALADSQSGGGDNGRAPEFHIYLGGKGSREITDFVVDDINSRVRATGKPVLLS